MQAQFVHGTNHDTLMGLRVHHWVFGMCTDGQADHRVEAASSGCLQQAEAYHGGGQRPHIEVLRQQRGAHGGTLLTKMLVSLQS